MPRPKRIQLRREKGFNLQQVSRDLNGLPAKAVTRPGPWGNPMTVESCLEAGFASDRDEARSLCVDAFRDWLLKGDLSEWWFLDGEQRWKFMRENLWNLTGINLACFCPLDRPCHADVLLELANR